MNAPLFRLTLFVACLAPAARAEDSPPSNPPATTPAKPVTEEMIRARLADHIKTKANAKPPAAPATPYNSAATVAVAAATTTTIAAPANTAEAELAAAKTDPAAMLPKVEVRRTRTAEIEKEVFQQEKEIAREKLKTKSTDADRALNGTGKSKILSIFGGETTKQRETVASERVSLMESERDIMEAIAYAKTKEEKDALRKELTELKALRRDLESALR